MIGASELATTYCPHCGKQMLFEGQKFCAYCAGDLGVLANRAATEPGPIAELQPPARDAPLLEENIGSRSLSSGELARLVAPAAITSTLGTSGAPPAEHDEGRSPTAGPLKWVALFGLALVAVAIVAVGMFGLAGHPGGPDLCGANARLTRADQLAQQMMEQGIQIGVATGDAQESADFRSLVATDAPAILDATNGLDGSLASATFADDPALLVDLRNAAQMLTQVGNTFNSWVSSGYPTDPTGFSATWTAAVQANQYLGQAKNELSALDASGVLKCGQ